MIRPAEHVFEGVAESPVLPGQIMAHPAAHVSEGSESRIRSPLNPFLIAVMVILPVIQVFQVWLIYRQRQAHHRHTHGRKHS